MAFSPINENKKEKPGDSQRDNAAFLNNPQNNTAQAKPNLIQAPSITLPKGGGAIKSIDDKFQVNAVNGTAGYTIPLPLSPGRNGFTPSLSLSYNSGSGNSIFGIGWGIEVPAIHRKTEKELPQYQDAIESDTFVFPGVEDLVPQLLPGPNNTWVKNSVTNNNITVTRYSPRIEGGFAKIEKIEDSGNVYWKVTTKENIVSVFGKSNTAKLSSPVPGESDRIFKWCLEYSYDDKGNFTSYYYKTENTDNIAPSLFEKNRLNNIAPCTNIYLKGIKYGNTVAWYEGDALPAAFMFEMVLDYGEHDAEKPTLAEVNKWDARLDAFSDFKPGFELRTHRLCKRVLMFHHFAAEFGWSDYLVKSLDIVYDEQPWITYLNSVTETGYIWNTDGTLKSSKALPPVEFSYAIPGYSRDVQEISPANAANAPAGLSAPYQWTDLYSEGISGILSEQADGWFYKENWGNGQFSPAKLVNPRPSFNGLSDGTIALQDLEADGIKYAVYNSPALKGYFEMEPEGGWGEFNTFPSYPNINLKDPNLKFLDLNGDGMPDMLISLEQEYVWYQAEGKCGFDNYHLHTKANDDELGPRVVFADQDERLMIAVADMTGDGLSDIVLITYGAVSYYPNLGFGRFGAKVNMQMSSIFDSADDFNHRMIHFADVDGTGTTDIIYTGGDEIQVYFNQCGNSFSQPSAFFNPFAGWDDQSQFSVIDLLGKGTSCLVWSSPLPSNASAPLRYIDIMNGQKPHIMTGYKNNMGKEVTFEYQSSTGFYLNDKLKGANWVTKLPFPVQCVNKVVSIDRVSQTRFTSQYSYHHGYYDAAEREFRGFAMVVQTDTEEFDNYVLQTTGAGAVNSIEKDLYQPAVITKSWFHTGAYLRMQQMYHQLSAEYYPNAQLAAGEITDPGLAAQLQKYTLADAPLPNGLAAGEVSECFRALKGLPLRQEVYSDEGDPSVQIHPYSVTQYNYDTQRLQPKDRQKYSVFLPHEKQRLTLHFERNPADPRIEHAINVQIDPYGNVLQSASIVYGRVNADMTLPTANDRAKQTRQWVVYVQNGFTPLIDSALAYRLPVLYETQQWELNAGLPQAQFFTDTEIGGLYNTANIKLYDQTTTTGDKRKIAHSRTYFLKDNLSGPMPFGTIDTLALPYQNYQLAFTPTLLASIYGAKVNDALMRNKGNYVRTEGDSNYWIPSGTVYNYPDLSATPDATSIPPPTAADITFAKGNFYMPVAYQDNFGNLTKVFYDPYGLFMVKTVDAVKNEANAEAFNYRAMGPLRLRDANDNRIGVRYDELGRVVNTFVMGKETEFKGDPMDLNSAEASPLDQPSSVLTYDFRYYTTSGALPNRVTITVREQHYYAEPEPETQSAIVSWLSNLFGGGANNNQPQIQTNVTWQTSYSYSDGSGHEVLKKVQAAPGKAPQRDAQGKLVLDGNGNVAQMNTTPDLRWIGNGRTIVNNKGKAVKQYAPFFDSSPEYTKESELVEIGFTKLMYYDALGRLIRAENPDGTFSKVEFDAWMQQTWDENDTVIDSQWYADRINGGITEADQEAAQKTAVHYNTPSVVYFDSLARPFLAIVNNKTQRTNEVVTQEFYYTRTELDIQGFALSTTDTRSNVVMQWQYNMLGHIGYQTSMDAGERWMIADVMGKTLNLWDSRQQIFTYEYDALRRPLNLLVNTGDGYGNYTYGQFVYGENVANAKTLNLLGKMYQNYDTAGVITNNGCDFKGNILSNTRALLADYKKMPDWKIAQSLDAATYTNDTVFDALNRPIVLTSPDGSIFIPGYDESNLLKSMDVKLQGAATATNFISSIGYNAKGQRESIKYGNNTACNYDYDLKTYRLTRLLCTANNGNNILQDLHYTFDPVGNITRQFDNAQKTVFYGGQQVEAQNDYIYDAVYRLVQGNGREHIGQVTFNNQDNFNDNWCNLPLQPNSAVQIRNYIEKYFYDGVGNILKMVHTAGSSATPHGSWTRTYQYNASNNQLTKTGVGGHNYNYTYNEHGSMLNMPQLQVIDWNFKEEMQHANLGGGGDAYYVYDSSGQRTRKVIERLDGTIVERIYLGPYEIYRERTTTKITLQRDTLHIMDGKSRIAMVETRISGNDGSALQLIRYQYSNHLGSACLELDDHGKIISYEEYHPFGTSAYRATDASRQVPARRYRFTGAERDDETGLNYHSRRYYVPWLGRWTAADPIGIGDGLDLYAYAQNNPMHLVDPKGTEAKPKHKTKSKVETKPDESGIGTIPARPIWEFFQTPEWKATMKKALAYDPFLHDQSPKEDPKDKNQKDDKKPDEKKPDPKPEKKPEPPKDTNPIAASTADDAKGDLDPQIQAGGATQSNPGQGGVAVQVALQEPNPLYSPIWDSRKRLFHFQVGLLQPTTTIQYVHLWVPGAPKPSILAPPDPLPPPDAFQLSQTVSPVAFIFGNPKGHRVTLTLPVGIAGAVATDLAGQTTANQKSGTHLQILGLAGAQVDITLSNRWSLTLAGGYQGGRDYNTDTHTWQKNEAVTGTGLFTYHFKGQYE
ncbi:SpvB/TcaC N-terminal domain-containing protein [Mucilaginibacter gotjawali]|uniref:RHS repeat-associated protein n=2 Tax=Mucilaginibacter gotjawali TaxID=1550579 RepID=A0A839SKX9_9SPHI|nr:SpvB/TcaC N-terminal domain-containing protein [Mucilaginibacter gotjawali]MBB3058172.1 RHS repeat-associated protein [Mucilaginibacter gotjawali]BAU54872.1 Mono(ADP-ribosyl)transferase SpvB [Mucilaginibacter gotjawali]